MKKFIIMTVTILLVAIFALQGIAVAADVAVDGAQIADEPAAALPEDIPEQPVEPEVGAAALPAPAGLYAKMRAGEQNVVEFGWKSGGHDYVVVFRSVSGEYDWKDLGGVSQSDYGDNCYFLDRNVVPGITYDYQLLYYNLDSERSYTNPVTFTVPQGGVDPDLPIPRGLYAKMRAGSSNVVEIGWQNMGFDADVYRATSANGPYTLYTFNLQWDTIDEFEDPRLLDKTVQPGMTYYYKVCSIIYWDDDYSDVIRGEFSAPVSIKVPDSSSVTLPAPTGLSAQMSYINPGQVWVNWNSVTGASGYQVYRKADTGSDYTLMADAKSGTSTSAWDTNATPGKTYYYKIRAYKTTSGATQYSDFTAPVSLKIPGASTSVGRVTGVAAKSAGYNSAKITWNRVSGADGYYVYRKTSANGSFSALKKLTSGGTLSYTDRNLTSNKVYYYKVVAYKNNGSSITKGTSSVTVKARPVVAAVTGLRADSWGKRVELTWNKSAGASGYIVQWARSRNGTWMNLKILGNTSTFTDYDLEYGVVYYYRVIPYRTISGTRVNGSPSSVVYGGYYGY